MLVRDSIPDEGIVSGIMEPDSHVVVRSDAIRDKVVLGIPDVNSHIVV